MYQGSVNKVWGDLIKYIDMESQFYLIFQLLIAPDDTYILIVQQNKEKDEEPKAESQEG